MASRCVFSTAVAYALSKVGKEGLVLKKEQLQTIRNLYNGKDVFLWLPTGFGKSICYEVLPFLFDYKSSRAGPGNSTVLVVSPLVSLMLDQVCSPRARTILRYVYGNISRMRKQCVPGPLPSFGRGLGTRL